MLPQSTLEILGNNLTLHENSVHVHGSEWLESQRMDQLVWQAVFGSEEERTASRFLIWEIAQEVGVRPASIHDFYVAVGRGEIDREFTVPAMNLRGMTYDMARAIFRQAMHQEVGAFVFEIARSEMGYTEQTPAEFSTVILAAVLREGYRGPVFLQGDHFQAKVSAEPGTSVEGELEAIQTLIVEAIEAGFYNIDIDCSTLVDLTKPSEAEQQEHNIRCTAQLLSFIRSHEPDGMTISVGGEIGHIGGKNSTVEDFSAFMEGLLDNFEGKKGISKVSVQTGSSHGGVILADGTIATVPIDFSTLSSISGVAREKYSMGGAVQHGASTLPDEMFARFPEAKTLEIHLATGWQNLIFDHIAFPEALKQEMYSFLDQSLVSERKPEWTDEQFRYKLRKKTWGPFKQKLWSIDDSVREKFRTVISQRVGFLFSALKVEKTREMVDTYIRPVELHRAFPKL